MNAIALVHAHDTPSALIERDIALEALNIVCGVAAKTGTMPILANALIERTADVDRCVTIRTTDLDMQIEINVRANVSDEFVTAVPAHLLRDIIRRVPEADRHRLSLEMIEAPAETKQAVDADGEPILDDFGNPVLDEVRRNRFVSDKLRVRLGRASFDLTSAVVDDFPALPPFEEEPLAFTVAGSAFWNALDSVLGAISTEETRYYLNGVFLHVVGPDTLAATATDGHRLLRQEIRGVEGIRNMPSVIVPRKAVELLHGLLAGKGRPSEIEVFVGETKFAVNWGPVGFMTKLVDGTFPDYARAIPTGNDKVAVVSAPKLLRSIGAVTALTADRGKTVRCRFDAGALTLSVVDPETGRGSIDMECAYDGEPVEIGFNAGYLADMIARAAPDKTEVTIAMCDATTPVLLTGSIAGWSGVLMPTRV